MQTTTTTKRPLANYTPRQIRAMAATARMDDGAPNSKGRRLPLRYRVAEQLVREGRI